MSTSSTLQTCTELSLEAKAEQQKEAAEAIRTHANESTKNTTDSDQPVINQPSLENATEPTCEEPTISQNMTEEQSTKTSAAEDQLSSSTLNNLAEEPNFQEDEPMFVDSSEEGQEEK